MHNIINKKYVGEITKVHTLNIDAGMVTIEKLLDKYLPAFAAVDNVYYIKGRRLPTTNNDNIRKYRALGLVSNVPWHPYRTLPMLLDMLEYYQYKHTAYGDLFVANPLCNTGSIYHLTPSTSDSSIVLSYVDILDPDDLNEVMNIFLEIYLTALKDIYMTNPNNVYQLDTMSNEYRLLQYDDVRVFRFNELIDIKQER